MRCGWRSVAGRFPPRCTAISLYFCWRRCFLRLASWALVPRFSARWFRPLAWISSLFRYFGFRIGTSADLERLAAFLAISMFAASMARQKTLAELRADRTTREMAAIVEYSCDAIYSSRPDGTITSWNRAAEQLYGYPAEEAIGLPVARLAPPERLDEVDRNLALLNGGGRVASYRTERMRKDGTRCPILLSVSSLRNARGKIVGTSAIARDLSAEKQSEEAMRRSEKLATAGRLAASIAHEINNPLEAVVNLLYLARHDSRHAVGYLTQAEQEVGRVARLAQQTLGFVRDASSPASMDPAAIMDEILHLYSRKLRRPAYPRNATLPRLLRRQWLCGRVAAVTGESSGECGRCDGGRRISASPRGHGPRLVQRQGRESASRWPTTAAGFPATNCAKIFEPFYTTKKDTGTGLGLWVSRGIVQKHGGSIRVRSRTDGRATGTVFVIFLPQQHEISRAA